MPGLGLGFGAEELGREERRDGRKKTLEQRHLRAGGRRRRAVEESPDSVILYSSDHHSAVNGNACARSAGNLFSSASDSAVDRCSFGSDHDPFFSQLSALVLFPSRSLSFPFILLILDEGHVELWLLYKFICEFFFVVSLLVKD